MNLIDCVVATLSKIRNIDKRATINIAASLKNKIGIEIGGPSSFFHKSSYFPIYAYAKKIDGVNFSTNTFWEGEIQEGYNYNYGNRSKRGWQYISEATEIVEVDNNKYDFLLSCHNLEHIANPIKALKRWHEVLKQNGLICLILPNKKVTVDKKRPYTTFDHILEDDQNFVDEKDATHYEEIIKLHSVADSKELKDKQELIELINNNYNNRCAHYHIFDFPLIEKMLKYSGFDVIIQKEIHSIHLFVIAHRITNYEEF